jgi:hypothetical protein
MTERQEACVDSDLLQPRTAARRPAVALSGNVNGRSRRAGPLSFGVRLLIPHTEGVPMSIAIESAAAPMDIRALHQRMGCVYHQPVRVHSFTNKRFTVNFRVPLDQLRRIVPEPIDLDEISDTGLGMFSMCACDFWVSRIGWLPIPPVRNNDMLCRVSAKIRKGASVYRTYYTLRSDSSSHFLGFFGKRFSHFRKQVAEFVRVDDGVTYSLENRAADPLCRGKFAAVMASITKDKPTTTCFDDVDTAKQFVFDLDGSCGYSYERGMLSFQKIDYPPWDMYFCHDYSYEFPLMDYVNQTFGLQPELDCVLFMQNTKQTWGASWLYQNPR